MGQLQDVRLRNKRGAWIAFTLLVLGGIAAGTWSLTRSAPAPNGVLVHVEGCAEDCREALQQLTARLLGEHGFEAVPDVERRFPADLAEVLATARSEGAAHAMFLNLDAVEQREGAGGEERVQALVEVRLDAATAEGETLRVSRQVSIEGDDLQHAVKLAGDAVLESAADPLAAFLSQSVTVDTYLATAPTPREVEVRGRLERVRAGAEALKAVTRDFGERCAASREAVAETEGLQLRCSLRTSGPPHPCPSETLVSVLETGVVVHSASRPPRFRLGQRADVGLGGETYDRLLHWDPFARAYYMAHAPHMRPNADALGPHWSVHVELVSEPSGGETGSAIVMTRGSPRHVTRVVHREQAPVRIGLPRLAPDGVSLVFTRQEHPHAAPELMWMAASVGASPREATPFGVFGRFVDRPRESPAGDPAEAPRHGAASHPEVDPERVPLLVVTIPGVEGAVAGGDESPDEASPRSEEEQLFDDLLSLDDEERANLNLPRLAHLALMEVGRGGPRLVTRLGGDERPVQGLLGATDEGIVVASASREHGCTLGIYAWDSWVPSWVPVAGCLLSGAVATGPRGDAIYGTMSLSSVDDPVAGDTEVVRVDRVDGRITQLTHDGIEDSQVMAHVLEDGRVRLAFERRPPVAYARFAPKIVCAAWAPTDPGTPFTARPPPATPPPPGADGSPDPR